MPKNNSPTYPVKVIHSFPTWLPQTQTWMYNQVVELQRLGVDTQVVCEQTSHLEQFAVANIHSLENEPLYKRVWDKGVRMFRIRRHLDYLVEIGRDSHTQIIHSHFGNVGWANLGAVRKLQAKHVVTFYGMDVTRLPIQYPVWRKRYRQLFKDVNLVLCEGSHMASCVKDLGCPDQKVKVQHLGIEIDKLQYQPRRWNTKGPFRVLIAAGFREKKGIPYALQALGAIKGDIPLEVTIIGDANHEHRNKEEKKHILETINQVGLHKQTRMLGYQPYSRLLEEAYQHHLFLSPSVTSSDGDTEGGAPVSIIEMIATGMPVVSTTHCDIPEIINYGNSNWLVAERDVTALIKNIRWLIGHPEDWGTMLDTGRKHIETNYSAVIQGGKLAEIYHSVC